MYGVILWCDAQENKAVIWCEDHGDLAFYRKTELEVDLTLDAGDWVQFEVTTERHLNIAHNPRLISQGVAVDLASVLTSAASTNDQLVHSRTSAEIIPFAPMQNSQIGETNPRPAAHLAQLTGA
ncbi:MAG: hypothetical protein KUG70_06810 [Rhodobacteraceae bacterium]|nr:hypothetical protein [Paracoccaceae bacterium]